MKLVGASNIYVRGPFVVSGIMYGVISALITLALMAAAANWSDTLILRLAGVQIAADFGLIVNVLSNYFQQNFPEIFLIIMGAGIILGGVSSYIAARRYLRVERSELKKTPATGAGGEGTEGRIIGLAF